MTRFQPPERLWDDFGMPLKAHPPCPTCHDADEIDSHCDDVWCNTCGWRGSLTALHEAQRRQLAAASLQLWVEEHCLDDSDINDPGNHRAAPSVSSLAGTCTCIELALRDLEQIRGHGLEEAEVWCLNALRALVALGATQIDRARFAFNAVASPGYPEDLEASLLDRFQDLRSRVEEVLGGN
jgi:hypothetical protein